MKKLDFIAKMAIARVFGEQINPENFGMENDYSLYLSIKMCQSETITDKTGRVFNLRDNLERQYRNGTISYWLEKEFTEIRHILFAYDNFNQNTNL